jgi:hypothetical protein
MLGGGGGKVVKGEERRRERRAKRATVFFYYAASAARRDKLMRIKRDNAATDALRGAFSVSRWSERISRGGSALTNFSCASGVRRARSEACLSEACLSEAILSEKGEEPMVAGTGGDDGPCIDLHCRLSRNAREDQRLGVNLVMIARNVPAFVGSYVASCRERGGVAEHFCSFKMRLLIRSN